MPLRLLQVFRHWWFPSGGWSLEASRLPSGRPDGLADAGITFGGTYISGIGAQIEC